MNEAHSMVAELLIALFSLAFGAGGAYFALKQGRKDVNGLGRKVNSESTKSETRYNRLCLALMLVCDPQQKNKIASILLGKEDKEDS
jgi:hypothetical protein